MANTVENAKIAPPIAKSGRSVAFRKSELVLLASYLRSALLILQSAEDCARSLDDPHTLRSLGDVRRVVTDLLTKSDRDAGSYES
jgi:hypothetical protein